MSFSKAKPVRLTVGLTGHWKEIEMSECPHCKFMADTFHEPIKTNYDYWVATEVFVYLHDGKDYCNYKEKGVSMEVPKDGEYER
jgi:glutaredoxin